MSHPTKKAVVFTLVGGVLLVAASTGQAGWLFVLGSGVLGLVWSSFATRHRLRNCHVELSLPARARAGDDIRVGLQVTNTGSRALPLTRTDLKLGTSPLGAVAVERLRPRAHARGVLPALRIHRGVYHGGEILLSSTAPFGLARSRHSFGHAGRLTVVPRHVDLMSFPLLEPASYPDELLHERARIGAGQEYLGVRDYRSGDPMRTIHWRSTARAGRLVVREYAEEFGGRVALVLVGGERGQAPESDFEALVSSVASVAGYALRTGHRVELVRAGRQDVESLHEPDMEAVLEWLAAAEPSDSPVAGAVAESVARVARRGTVVLFTTTASQAAEGLINAISMIQTAGSRAIAVVARSSTWEGPADDREHHLLTAARGRVQWRVLEKDRDLAACLQA